LKWDYARKHPDVRILGNGDHIKTTPDDNNTDQNIGMMASTGYTIGSDEVRWYFTVYEESVMHFGAATADQDLTTVSGVAVKELLTVDRLDRVRISITPGSTMTIRHETGDSKLVSATIHDLTSYNTQILYPWVSTSPPYEISIKMLLDQHFEMDVRPDGLVRMSASRNDIIDFNLTDISKNDITSSGVAVATTTIVNEISGAFVEATDDGAISINGGIALKYENITAGIPNVVLRKDQYAVMITNPATTTVQLPPAVDAGKSRQYIIIRNYPTSNGETWQNPRLQIITTGGDTIEGNLSCGLPSGANIQLFSDSVNKWRIC
jgi:hypothetical protein